MLSAPGYDVLGATVAGPPPLGRVQLALEPGVTVLYGRNGSGKTRLLGALADAFGASSVVQGGDRDVLVRIRRDALASEGQESGWLKQLDRSLRAALSAQAEARLQASGDPDVADVIEDPPATLDGLIRAVTDMRLWRDNPALVDRIRSDGLVAAALRPGGRVCGPAVSFDALVDCNDDDLLWESIEWVDRLLANHLGTLEGEVSGAPHLDPVAVWNDRWLEPRALRDVQQGDYAARAYREDWNAYPVGAWGALAEAPVRLAGWTTDTATIRARTLEALRRSTKRVVEAVIDEEVVLTAEATSAVAGLIDKANLLLRLTLLEAPELRLEFGTPDQWMDASAPRWEALDEASSTWVDIADLSTAQHRWATLAVELSLTELEPDRPVVVLLDEPEAALHRAAETHLVTGLKRLAVELGDAAVIVATHSPAFLADPGVRAVHVQRSLRGLATTSEVQLALGGEADHELAMVQLGLQRRDTLQLARVAVVVEGAHDEAVLNGVGGTLLAESRALVLRMHGAKNTVSVLDARLLVDMTDAKILVVLDNDASRQLERAWEDLRGADAAGDHDRARSQVGRIQSAGTAEAEWLAELAERALATGRLDRIAVFPLAQADIIEYLDPAAFRLNESWPTLRRAWRAEGRNRPDFKTWLRRERGAAISTQRVAKAAATLGPLPADLAELLSTVSRLAWTPAGPAG